MVSEEKPNKDEKETVFFHTLPFELAEEVVHSYGCEALIDLTPADGKWALTAIKKRKPYCGVCFTIEHRQFLLARLRHLVFLSMQDATCGFVLYHLHSHSCSRDWLHALALSMLAGMGRHWRVVFFDVACVAGPACAQEESSDLYQASLVQVLQKKAKRVKNTEAKKKRKKKEDEEDDEEEEEAEEEEEDLETPAKKKKKQGDKTNVTREELLKKLKAMAAKKKTKKQAEEEEEEEEADSVDE